eukprot:gnl/Chilomastix_cuspidata/2991.p1 GENE.gnl/Chilomastix_cuspidata/2991~~gnl/Chilomastix_cuspidata/2991.p1  ORF type:complete len:1335 (+),score=316.29 gnl/Chilomastix_cuspidata/2991:246-4007(+)
MSTLITLLNLLLILAQAVCTILESRAYASFIDVFSTNEAGARFWTWAVLVVFSSQVLALADLTGWALNLEFRRLITRAFQATYFSDRNFYKVNRVHVVDNPDQRIAHDVKLLTGTLCGANEPTTRAALLGSRGVLSVFVYSAVLIVYCAVTIGALALALLAVVGVAAAVIVVASRRISARTYALERAEGNLRYQTTRVRDNAESIAFIEGGADELASAYEGAGAVQRAMWSLARAFFPSSLSVHVYTYLSQALIYLVLFAPALANAAAGMPPQHAFLCGFYCLSALVHSVAEFSALIPELAGAAGLIRRLSGMCEPLGLLKDPRGRLHIIPPPYSFENRACVARLAPGAKRNALSSARPPGPPGPPGPVAGEGAAESGHGGRAQRSDVRESQNLKIVKPRNLVASAPMAKATAHSEPSISLLLVENVSISSPTMDLLVSGISFSVRERAGTLIMGPSGSGKSSLLRAIAGLWPYTGWIEVPAHISYMFLPQSAYTTLGTLRDQVLYPWNAYDFHRKVAAPTGLSSTDVDVIVRTCLVNCGLQYLLARFTLDALAEWANILSVGEKQRLAFARLFLHNPQLVLMDEATSALDPSLEAELFAELRRRGITFVAVTHHESLVRYAWQVLVLRDGAWELGPAVAPEGAPLPSADDERFETLQVRKYEVDLEHRFSCKVAVNEKHLSTASALKRFFYLARPHARSRLSLLYGALLLVLLLDAALVVAMAVIGARLHVLPSCALQADETAESCRAPLVTNLTVFFCIALGRACALTTALMLQLRMGADTRELLSQRMFRSYFAERAFYRLGVGAQAPDNPDQRLTSDTRITVNDIFGSVMPSETGALFGLHGLAHALLQAVAIAVYAMVSGEMRAAMLLCVVCVWLLGMVVQYGVAIPVKACTKQLQQCEGNFQFAHSRIRQFAETIAFYGGQFSEEVHCRRLFLDVLRTQRRLARWCFVTNSWSQLFSACARGLLPAGLLLALGSGNAGLAGFFADAELLAALAVAMAPCLTVSRQLLTLLGTTWRLADLHAAVARLPPDFHAVEHADALSVEGVAVAAPDGRWLVDGLSLTLGLGEPGVLVTGASGVGKSSLLRVLCGLWDAHRGRVCVPHDGAERRVCFVPQRPYVPRAPLRRQVTYPARGSSDDAKIERILRFCRLGYLLDRFSLDRAAPFEDILSDGEKQRLAFARVFYSQPKFLFLDEATSAIPEELEHLFFERCAEKGIAIISVSHRLSSLDYFTRCLVLERGGWRLLAVRG